MLKLLSSLSEYISTEQMERVVLYYMFGPVSPSEILGETKIPLSSVDRVTNTLKVSGFLEEVRSEGRKWLKL